MNRPEVLHPSVHAPVDEAPGGGRGTAGASVPSPLQTRAGAIGIEVVVGDHSHADFTAGDYCGAIVQYPNTIINF